MDVEAIGNELKFPEDSMCISTKVALEDKGKLSSLKLADPAKDGRIPDYLESLAEAKKIITDSIVSAVDCRPLDRRHRPQRGGTATAGCNERSGLCS